MALRLVESLCPLSVVGQLDVPAAALQHYHVVEALACASVLTDGRERVVGTTNDAAREPALELYGWAPCVQPHTDGFGWVYFCPLSMRLSKVSAKWGKGVATCHLRRGAVYRLDDRVKHWTRDAGPTCALYYGFLKAPNDQLAINTIRLGIAMLRLGSRQAPRVKFGFRCPAPWECWVDTKDGRELMPLADAKRRRLFIATCSETGCHEPAYSIDRHFPYHQEHNRCRKHFRESG